MNRKKIEKIICSIISGVYICNSFTVFASNEDIVISVDSAYDTEVEKVLEEIDNKDKIESENSENINDNQITVSDSSDKLDDSKSEDELIDIEGSNGSEFSDNAYTDSPILSVTDNFNGGNPIASENTIDTDNISSETINLDANIVEIPDSNLLKKLNSLLGKPESNTILYADEIATLKGHIYIQREDISNLSGLEYAVNITGLTLSDNNITDITPLSNLNNLTSLNLSNNNIEDISPLYNMKSLNTLSLVGNYQYAIDELLKFETMPNLNSLSISINAPSYNLTIGNEGYFSKIDTLIFSNSNFGNVMVKNAPLLRSFGLYTSDASSLSISGSEKISYLNITELNATSVDIKNADDYLSITAGDNNIDSLTISACKVVSNVLFPRSNIRSLTLLDFGGSSTINLSDSVIGSAEINGVTASGANFTSATVESLKLIESNLSSLYLSSISADEVYIDNVKFTSSIYGSYSEISKFEISNSNPYDMNLGDSKIKNFIIGTEFSCSSLTLSRLETESDVVINSINVKYLYLGNSKSNSLKLSNLNNLTSLDVNGISTNSLTICNCPQLSSIYLNSLKTNSIELMSLPTLSSLGLNNIEADSIKMDSFFSLNSLYPSNISVNSFEISNFPVLKYFYLTDISAEGLNLKTMNSLNTLNLSNCNLNFLNLDFSPMLNSVNINGGNIKDVSMSNTLVGLKTLTISDSQTETLQLSDCGNLNFLSITNTNISSIDTINAPSVTNLILSNNKIEDISPLSSFVNITSIDISGNKIKDISVLKSINNLDSKNIKALNQVVDVDSIYSKDATIKVEYNNIVDYDGSILPINHVSSNGEVNSTKATFMYTTAGEYNENIEFLSGNVEFSVNLIQKIYIDDVAPIIEVLLDNDKYTNNNVNLIVKAYDSLTGVSHIILPNGDIVYSDECLFEIRSNGEYEFEVFDFTGNSIKETISVSNIDKDLPLIESSVIYNESKTEAIIKINAVDDLSGILSITLPDGKTLNQDEASFIVHDNGIYVVEVSDNAGNVDTIEVKIDSINKITTDDTSNTDIPDTSGISHILILSSITSVIFGTFLSLKKRK